MTAHPPSGTVTFLLTDLEGSTRMWEQDPAAMKVAMVRHDELLARKRSPPMGALSSRGWATAWPPRSGRPVRPPQRPRPFSGRWPTRVAHRDPLRARVGLHTDEAVIIDNSYDNQPVNRCSRLMAAAHGGQIVVSGATESLVHDEIPDGVIDRSRRASSS